ncbi:hypothetical protein CRM22_007217 [Opisthorchis felineus]|uniref:Uncharacterized protein n=1 Tax=Opisthorchis felineus TaxID=147828 RepID=A0A4S2LGU8_OPIFE|nr:hypothetical protein CRM22_007217 [Opisthorchis felineus]
MSVNGNSNPLYHGNMPPLQGWAQRSRNPAPPLGRESDPCSKLPSLRWSQFGNVYDDRCSQRAVLAVDKLIEDIRHRSYAKNMSQRISQSSHSSQNYPRFSFNKKKSYSLPDRPKVQASRFGSQRSKVEKIISEFLQAARERGLHTRSPSYSRRDVDVDSPSRQAPTNEEMDLDCDPNEFHQTTKLIGEQISPPPISPDLVRYWEDSMENDQLTTEDPPASPDLFEPNPHVPHRLIHPEKKWEIESNLLRRPLNNAWWSSQPVTERRRKLPVPTMTQQPPISHTKWRKIGDDVVHSVGSLTSGNYAHPTSQYPESPGYNTLHPCVVHRDWDFHHPAASHGWSPDDFQRYREAYRRPPDQRQDNSNQAGPHTWDEQPSSWYRENRYSRGEPVLPQYSRASPRGSWLEERYSSDRSNDFRSDRSRISYSPDKRKILPYERFQKHCRCCRFNKDKYYDSSCPRDEFREGWCRTQLDDPTTWSYEPIRERDRFLVCTKNPVPTKTREQKRNCESRSMGRLSAIPEISRSPLMTSENSGLVQADSCSPIRLENNPPNPAQQRSKLSSVYPDETFKTLSSLEFPSTEATNLSTLTYERSPRCECKSKTPLTTGELSEENDARKVNLCGRREHDASGEEPVTSSQGIGQSTKVHRLPPSSMCYATPIEQAPKEGCTSPPEPRGLSRNQKPCSDTAAGLKRTFSFKALATSTPCIKRVNHVHVTNEATPCARNLSPTTTVVLRGSTDMRGNPTEMYQSPRKNEFLAGKDPLSYEPEE